MFSKPKHNWRLCKGQTDRIVLCLLKRSYHRKFIAPLFNHIFAPQLSKEGFRHMLDIDALDGQWQHMRRGGKGHEIFVVIHGASTQTIECKYQPQLQDIKAAILHLKLGVTFSTAKLAKFRNPARAIRRRRREPSMAITVSTESEGEVNDAHPVRPQLQQFAYHRSRYFDDNLAKSTAIDATDKHGEANTTVPPGLRSNLDHEGKVVQNHPILLFRATDCITSFQSRKVQATGCALQPPPAFGSADFMHIVRPHLQQCKAYPSPFLSFAQNPQNAMSRIEVRKSAEMDQKMFLAIFTYNDLHRSGLRTYEGGSGPYLVSQLFQPGEVSDLPKGYTGAGEWLQYGSIDCEPITTLDSTQVIKLAISLRKFKAGDIDALIDVSKSISNVPKKWKQNIAYNIFGRYCGRSNLPAVGSEPYKLLMNVVDEGSILSLTKLKRFFRRCETEEVEHGWTVRQLGRSHQDEIGDDADDDDRDDGTFLPSSSRRKAYPVVRQFTTSDTINKLNQLASPQASHAATNGQHLRRRDSPPLWSPDSDSENQTYSNADGNDAIHHNHPRQLTLDEIPQIILSTPNPQQTAPEEKIVPSIEVDTTIDTFTAELISSSTQELSPFDTPIPTPRRRLFRNVTDSRSESTISTAQPTTFARDIPPTKTPGSTPHPKPNRTRFRITKRDEIDDDFVIIGSGHRDRVQLPFRSLSVQESPAKANVEVEVLDSDDDFMSAEEEL